MALESTRRGRTAAASMAVVWGAFVLGAVWSSTVVRAQPGGQPAGVPARSAPPEPFAQVFAEWSRLDQQINDLAQRYRDATTTPQRDLLRSQYMQALEIARQTLARLRLSAANEYQLAPNQNAEVTRTLIGILANDVRSDDYLAAADVARLLLEKKCAETPLWDLAGKAAFCIDDFDSAEQLLRKADEYGAIDESGKKYLAELPMLKQKWRAEEALRNQEATANDLPRVRLQTTKGDIVLELFENEAPQTVANFVSLVDRKFYDGLTFHRVLAGFMAQTGCPQGNGSGGPGYQIYDECTRENRRNHFSGTLSMAKSALPNTGGSQFFMTFCPTPHLDGKHTAFGRVIEGMEVLPRLQRNDPTRPSRVEPDRIVRAQVVRRRPHPYEPTKVQ